MKLTKPLDFEDILQAASDANSNLAKELSTDDLNGLASELLSNIEADDLSRSDWLTQNAEYLKMALQVTGGKTWPWPKASNVKFPLITVACLQFQARAYKALFNEYRLVKGKVIGKDPQGVKAKKANNISLHMSYQLREQMEGWADDMDKALLILPMCGNVFKKTYRIPGKNVSELVLPQDLIVNFYAKALASAPRITHAIEHFKNDILTQVRSKLWTMQKDLPEKGEVDRNKVNKVVNASTGTEPSVIDSDTPFQIYECHCWLDLDDDGYKEPYIVTLIKEIGEIVRIVPNFNPQMVEHNEDNEIVSIKADQIFTNYRFIPHPISGVYALGFGSLIGPLNASVDSIINQLIDAGTLSNLPSGFISRSIRMRNGEQPLKPGEWRVVNNAGDDLRKGVFAFPTPQPSPVLFNLLTLLIQSAKEIPVVSDIMLGQNPGQNQPYRTTASVLEQGLVVFTSITKRIFSAFSEELKKLYQLNKNHITADEYFAIIDEQGNAQEGAIPVSDYEGDDTDVVPSADPDVISDVQKMAKADELAGLMQMGTINPQEATKRILEARGHEDIEALMTMPDPQPNFDQQLEMQRLQLEAAKMQGDQQVNELKAQTQLVRDQAAAEKSKMEAMVMAQQAQLEQERLDFEKRSFAITSALETANTQLEEQRVQNDKAKSDLAEREKKTKKYNKEKKTIE